jgi:transposase InsO family protein
MPEIDSKSMAWALVQVLISKHGIPKAITLDRGSQFTSDTWACICTLTGINHRLSTAYHPQTDGSTERMNSTVETYLRVYICYDQKDWNRLLLLAELAINSCISTATGVSPFYLSHGYNLSPFTPTEEVEQLAEEPAKSPI